MGAITAYLMLWREAYDTLSMTPLILIADVKWQMLNFSLPFSTVLSSEMAGMTHVFLNIITIPAIFKVPLLYPTLGTGGLTIILLSSGSRV